MLVLGVLEHSGDGQSVWESVGDLDWVCGDVWDVKIDLGHGDVKVCVEKGNVVVAVKEYVEVGLGIVDGMNDDGMAAEI